MAQWQAQWISDGWSCWVKVSHFALWLMTNDHHHKPWTTRSIIEMFKSIGMPSSMTRVHHVQWNTQVSKEEELSQVVQEEAADAALMSHRLHSQNWAMESLHDGTWFSNWWNPMCDHWLPPGEWWAWNVFSQMRAELFPWTPNRSVFSMRQSWMRLELSVCAFLLSFLVKSGDKSMWSTKKSQSSKKAVASCCESQPSQSESSVAVVEWRRSSAWWGIKGDSSWCWGWTIRDHHAKWCIEKHVKEKKSCGVSIICKTWPKIIFHALSASFEGDDGKLMLIVLACVWPLEQTWDVEGFVVKLGCHPWWRERKQSRWSSVGVSWMKWEQLHLTRAFYQNTVDDQWCNNVHISATAQVILKWMNDKVVDELWLEQKTKHHHHQQQPEKTLECSGVTTCLSSVLSAFCMPSLISVQASHVNSAWSISHSLFILWHPHTPVQCSMSMSLNKFWHKQQEWMKPDNILAATTFLSMPSFLEDRWICMMPMTSTGLITTTKHISPNEILQDRKTILCKGVV